jgi:glycosyltransferase involved in cell wall biosynthesis
MPAFHIIGLHHTIPDDRFSACAFTGKIQRLPAVLRQAYNHPSVTIYCAGEPDLGDCGEYVTVRSEAELKHNFGTSTEQIAARYAELCNNEPSRAEFEEDLIPHLRRRVEDGDFILHPFGGAHRGLLKRFPKAIHVESGIGYMSGPFGAYRIFESESWRHWHFGRFHDARDGYTSAMVGSGLRGPDAYDNTFVAANYYNTADWDLGTGEDDYVLFAGRIDPCKGIDVVAELARRMPTTRFVIAGGPAENVERFVGTPVDTYDDGDEAGGYTLPDNVEYVGTVRGRDRSALYGNARCAVMPSRFCEPFAGVAAEAALCGTPVLAPPVGAFTDGRPVVHCRSVTDYECAIADLALDQRPEAHTMLARTHTQAQARALFGYDAVGKQYRRAFDALARRP